MRFERDVELSEVKVIEDVISLINLAREMEGVKTLLPSATNADTPYGFASIKISGLTWEEAGLLEDAYKLGHGEQ